MHTTAAEQPERSPSEQEIIVARQPIYNNGMGVFGYELLFRSPGDDPKGLRPTEATAQVLASTILEFGLNQFVNDRKAVINVTRAFIEVIAEIQLPPDQIVLDLPDNLAINEELIARLEELRSMGYGLSIGGLSNLKDQRLLPIADIFRVDVQRITASQLDALTKFLRRHKNLALQALKVETMEEYRSYCDQGFDYLQGYFLSRPRVYVSRDLSTNKLAILQLLSVAHNPDTPIQELERQIMHDVSLSYKLIRLINAPFFGVPQKIDSIQRAIVLLGRDEIRKWVSLLALSGMSDEPPAIMEIAVLRAKMCELLAEKAGLPKDRYFTVGMFSALDMLMRQPIKNILSRLPLNETVKAAILERRGTLGDALSCALAMENAQWSGIGFMDLGPGELSEVYRQAIQWTEGMIGQF